MKQKLYLRQIKTYSLAICAALLITGCGDDTPGSSSSTSSSSQSSISDNTPTGGTEVQLIHNKDELAQFEALRQKLVQADSVNTAQFLAQNNVTYLENLSYSPADAADLALIQDTALALSGAELDKLNENGFVISPQKEYQTFLRGYADIYKYHLPVYVSADAVLESVHQSYDELLKTFELASIIPRLQALLADLSEQAKAKPMLDEVRSDLLLYLGVTISLLDGQLQSTGNSEIDTSISNLIDKAKAASGISQVELFGVKRQVDFSQFKPRGHYAGSQNLENYFRAMMWLGRVDFRLIETQPNGGTVFHRQQYNAMTSLRALFSEQNLQQWNQIEQVLQMFIGESDYMTLPEIQALTEDLSNKYPNEIPLADSAIAQAIIDGGYGAQQIASHFALINHNVEGGYPLNRSFALFGQRYIVDSDVFSKVVYDRLASSGPDTRRMIPNALDAAYAALDNIGAASLLTDELNQYPALPGALTGLRTTVNDHAPAFWQANMYNLWIEALRSLSPTGDMTQQVAEGLPEVAATEAWNRRILNTQLGSWAQLRHDTLLYAKQSYSGVPGCEFPDAYVEPYPEFFAALAQYAEFGKALVNYVENENSAARIAKYWDALSQAVSILGDMASNQRRGEPHTQEQLAYINNAIRIEQLDGGCVTVERPTGWYADLFFGDSDKSITFDPTVADVHTSPADQNGASVGWVKHVATGRPRYIAVAVKNCTGVGIYSGMTFSYYEFTKDNFERMTDDQWANQIFTEATPDEVPWVVPIQSQP